MKKKQLGLRVSPSAYQKLTDLANNSGEHVCSECGRANGVKTPSTIAAQILEKHLMELKK